MINVSTWKLACQRNWHALDFLRELYYQYLIDWINSKQLKSEKKTKFLLRNVFLATLYRTRVVEKWASPRLIIWVKLFTFKIIDGFLVFYQLNPYCVFLLSLSHSFDESDVVVLIVFIVNIAKQFQLSIVFMNFKTLLMFEY